MNEKFQIHLNSLSADYYVNGLTSNCTWNLSGIIEAPQQSTLYVSVVHANIPYAFYNINSTNNRLDYTVNGQNVYLTIDVGNYNASQLASYFTKNMANFTCTYNSITNKFTFENSLYDFTFSEYSSCLDMLGFVNIPLYLTSILKRLVSSYCVDLNTKKCICISSNNWQTNNINSMDISSRNVLLSIPINSAPYSNIVYVNNSDMKSNLYTNIIQSISLKLTDQNSNIIDLNGCNWSISLEFSVVDFVTD